jgi:hypothetical protein
VSFIGSASSANVPFSPTGTLLADPSTILWIGGPVGADGAGAAPVAAPIPNNPVLSGMHIFVQAIALDPGGDIGVSASHGLDVQLL